MIMRFCARVGTFVKPWPTGYSAISQKLPGRMLAKNRGLGIVCLAIIRIFHKPSCETDSLDSVFRRHRWINATARSRSASPPESGVRGSFFSRMQSAKCFHSRRNDVSGTPGMTRSEGPSTSASRSRTSAEAWRNRDSGIRFGPRLGRRARGAIRPTIRNERRRYQARKERRWDSRVRQAIVRNLRALRRRPAAAIRTRRGARRGRDCPASGASCRDRDSHDGLHPAQPRRVG